jgi:hypothetical protein
MLPTSFYGFVLVVSLYISRRPHLYPVERAPSSDFDVCINDQFVNFKWGKNMKNKLFAVLASLMTYSAVYALPVYNPDQPELLKYGIFTGGDSGDFGIEVGYRGDFVFDRKLENKRNTIFGPTTKKDVPVYRSTINAGQLTLNLMDRFDVYGWAGARSSEVAKQLAFNVIAPIVGPISLPVRELSVTTKESLAWGVGARAVLWSSGNTAIGCDGQYAQSNAKFRSFTFNGVPIQASGLVDFVTNLPLDPSQFRDETREWQVSLGISHRICWMTPYVAVKYSDYESRVKGPEIGVPIAIPGGPTVIAPLNPNHKARSRNNVGFVCGVSIVDAERMHVTAEGRFVDERALTVAADFRF